VDIIQLRNFEIVFTQAGLALDLNNAQ
jgi:hypothetical protein